MNCFLAIIFLLVTVVVKVEYESVWVCSVIQLSKISYILVKTFVIMKIKVEKTNII